MHTVVRPLSFQVFRLGRGTSGARNCEASFSASGAHAVQQLARKQRWHSHGVSQRAASSNSSRLPGAWPNLALKRSTNGRPPGPVCGALHSPQPGPGVLPLAPA